MANKAEKWKDNVGGKFYVDQQCIDCDLCRETAPAFFKRQEDRILDKINSQGFGALTPEEKRILDEAKDMLSRR